MKFILDSVFCSDPKEIEAAFRKYAAYLQSIKDIAPPNAFSFATADWHYQPQDHRCPHDAWLESVLIEEQSSGPRSENRWINIVIRLLGAFHDGTMVLNYKSVLKYSLRQGSVTKGLKRKGCSALSHGDWLIDEITMSGEGNVVHKIVFGSNARWEITCKDITCEWQPFVVGGNGK